jgi:hypothetical protein
MRQMERKVRNLKREREALRMYGAKHEEIFEMNQKIESATDQYKEFCSQIGKKPSTSNLRYEVGTSDLHKTKAYKDYLKAKDEGLRNSETPSTLKE